VTWFLSAAMAAAVMLLAVIVVLFSLALFVYRKRDLAGIDARHVVFLDRSEKEHRAFLREWRATGRGLIEEFTYTVEMRVWEHEKAQHGIDAPRPVRLPVPGEVDSDGG